MAFNRIFGILIAIGIFIASIIFFAILPTLEFRKQKEALTLIAQVYEQTWRQHENESNQYTQYARLIDSQSNEFDQLVAVLRNYNLKPTLSGKSLTVSGKVSAQAFSELLSAFGNAYTLEINRFNASNSEKMPIQISESKMTTFDIRNLEVKSIQYNEKLSKRGSSDASEKEEREQKTQDRRPNRDIVRRDGGYGFLHPPDAWDQPIPD